MSVNRRGLPLWAVALIDLVCIVVFITVGLMSHAEQLTPASVAWAALPFIIARALLLLYPATSLALWPGGVVVWLGTWGFGMALRIVLGGGAAPTFLLVSWAVLGTLMLGWRLVAGLVSGRAPAQRGAPTPETPGPGD